MENWYNLKDEVDTKLEMIGFTEKMKGDVMREIRLTRSQSPKIRFKRYKIAFLIATMCCLLSGTVLAMDYIWGLELFFSKENLKKVSKEIQSIQSYSEENGVRLVVEEIISQPYKQIATISFINQMDTPWTEGIVCQDLNIEPCNGMGTSRGILSEDGKRLSYRLEISNNEKSEDIKVKVEAENLLQPKTTVKTLEVDIAPFYESTLNKVDGNEQIFDVSNDPFYVLLKPIKKVENKKAIILDKDYPSVSLIGVGFLINNEMDKEEMQRGETGLVIYTRNEEYLGYTNWAKDEYLRGDVSELTDCVTGEVYTAMEISLLEDGGMKGQVSASYFPNIKEEQIPNLKVTKVDYEKQEVIAEGNWEVEFELGKNENIIRWEPQIQWQEDEVIHYIDEVYLGAMGIEIKMHSIETKTNEILGEIIEPNVHLITKQGERINLQCGSGTSYWTEDEELEGYILSYDKRDEDSQVEFIEIDTIQEIVINGYTLEIGA